MQMTFRWYGADDLVTLEHIRQIPAVTGIVSALYNIPVGEEWPQKDLAVLQDTIAASGLNLAVIESIAVHEDIKLGHPGRDRLVDNFCRSIQNMGALGIPVLCYNFMPVFDWTRTNLAMQLADNSAALSYDHNDLKRIDLSKGTGDLPGWATAYTASELKALLAAYSKVDEQKLWDNLAWFLERVVPVAERAGVNLAIHPDDPPWPIFGLPRIITSLEALQKLIRLVDSPANGVTFCTGSLGAEPRNNIPEMIRTLGRQQKIHFVHARNVKITGSQKFHESPHPSSFGSVDMHRALKTLHETGFAGPMRPDHGRMIWGERGRAGYGLHDRALGAMYLAGLWEGLGGTVLASSAV